MLHNPRVYKYVFQRQSLASIEDKQLGLVSKVPN